MSTVQEALAVLVQHGFEVDTWFGGSDRDGSIVVGTWADPSRAPFARTVVYGPWESNVSITDNPAPREATV